MYKNVADLAALSMTTYSIAAIATVVSLLLAWFIANNIAFEGGLNPQDPKKRTRWFWVIGITLPILFFCFCRYGTFWEWDPNNHINTMTSFWYIG